MTPTALRLLQALDTTSTAASHLYDAGSDLAKWYKQNAHGYVIQAVAFLIAGCIHLWVNRTIIRNRIESLFTLDPYTPVKPVEVVVKEPEPTPLQDEPTEILWDIQPPSPRYRWNYSELMAMTNRELRAITGTRRKISKAQLVDMILA